ncbi:MAG: hypothetical protein QM571_06670 [Micrococcaceae bacterium]
MKPYKISKRLQEQAWILLVGALAPALDATIVNVALPTLGHVISIIFIAIGFIPTLMLPKNVVFPSNLFCILA